MCRRRLALVALAVSVVVAGIGSAAQEKPYPICTLDHFVNTMKTRGPNFMAVNTSLADQDFATTKERLTRSREQTRDDDYLLPRTPPIRAGWMTDVRAR